MFTLTKKNKWVAPEALLVDPVMDEEVQELADMITEYVDGIASPVKTSVSYTGAKMVFVKDK